MDSQRKSPVAAERSRPRGCIDENNIESEIGSDCANCRIGRYIAAIGHTEVERSFFASTCEYASDADATAADTKILRVFSNAPNSSNSDEIWPSRDALFDITHAHTKNGCSL